MSQKDHNWLSYYVYLLQKLIKYNMIKIKATFFKYF